MINQSSLFELWSILSIIFKCLYHLTVGTLFRPVGRVTPLPQGPACPPPHPSQKSFCPKIPSNLSHLSRLSYFFHLKYYVNPYFMVKNILIKKIHVIKIIIKKNTENKKKKSWNSMKKKKEGWFTDSLSNHIYCFPGLPTNYAY